jgi:flagellar hook-basal body complex protein FliE
MTPLGPVGSGLLSPGSAAAGTGTGSGGGFGAAVGQALTGLAQVTGQADQLSLSLATGGGAPLADTLVAVSQASLATEAAVTVVAKALQAYQSIMNMSV